MSGIFLISMSFIVIIGTFVVLYDDLFSTNKEDKYFNNQFKTDC